jgi:hypothetical protein
VVVVGGVCAVVTVWTVVTVLVLPDPPQPAAAKPTAHTAMARLVLKYIEDHSFGVGLVAFARRGADFFLA